MQGLGFSMSGVTGVCHTVASQRLKGNTVAEDSGFYNMQGNIGRVPARALASFAA